MPQTFLYGVHSVPTRDFLEALGAAGGTFTPPFVGGPIYNLPGVPPIASRRFIIRSISYLAIEQVGLEFDFFSSGIGGQPTNLVATDAFIARFQFGSVNGQKFNNTGLFRFYIDGLAIPYADADTLNSTTPPTLHVAVQNVDTVAKSVSPAGAIACTFRLEPMMAY